MHRDIVLFEQLGNRGNIELTMKGYEAVDAKAKELDGFISMQDIVQSRKVQRVLALKANLANIRIHHNYHNEVIILERLYCS